MVDEIGQYIGSDSDLMLNLQSIVEEIGSKCGGRVWVMVTSQEAIDSVTKIIGDDFSKIQGRFDTRLSLSSSSVDEVIKKRILEKNDAAKEMLKMNYEKNSGVLKNLFTFNSPYKMDLKGYSGENEFVETYPFVPYQFKLIPKYRRRQVLHQKKQVPPRKRCQHNRIQPQIKPWHEKKVMRSCKQFWMSKEKMLQ